MSVFCVCDLNYTRNSDIQLLLDRRAEMWKLELKVQEQDGRAQPCSPAMVSPAEFVAPKHNGAATAMYASMSRSARMPSSPRTMGANMASIAESSAHHQHPYASALSSSAVATSSRPVHGDVGPGLDMSDIQASMAMISDGSRYSGGHPIDRNELPPYSPGNQRTMPGHGNENNDARLSEYVKGETRAQDMKDGGMFQ